MSTLTLIVPSPCPQSVDGRPHTWQSGDSADLISYGQPDYGVTVHLGRCRYCAVPLLAVVSMSAAHRSGGPFLEVPGAEL